MKGMLIDSITGDLLIEHGRIAIGDDREQTASGCHHYARRH